MTFDWNAHRFSGGALALDLVNTVIFREALDRSQDRFADPAEVPRFAAAAADFRQREWGIVKFRAPVSQHDIALLIDVREATNRLFRAAARGDGVKPGPLSAFLRLGSTLVCDEPEVHSLTLPRPSEQRRELSLAAAAFLSGLRLFEPARLERIKVCPNCHWLYFDESRNRSRRWCDMSVCGNRAKAQRYYRRKGNGHA